MLTYITKALFVFDFKKYADRLFRKRSSHGPMLAYLMLHLQVGIRTQTRTQIAILSCFLWSQHCNLIVFMNIDLNNFLDNMETQLFLPLTVAPFDVDEEVQKKCWLSVSVLFRRQERQRIDKITIHRCSWSNHIIFVSIPRESVIY